MLTLPLTIRYSEHPLREPTAWFIGGHDPSQWLRAMTGWNISLADVKLFVVPQSRDDRRPRGVLAIPPAGGAPSMSASCQAYGLVAARLYLPVAAILTPEVADSELAALFSDAAAAYVFHPVCGLVRFDHDDRLSISDLLAAPIQRPADWDCAVPGLGFNQRLLAVEPDETPGIMEILSLGRDDIESRPPTLDNLPPAPDEPGVDLAARTRRKIIGGIANAAKWFSAKMPKTSSAPTWVDQLENWANKISQRQQQDLDAIRNREIQRLLHLLEAEPDEGLRFALPLAGEPHRGVAPPSGKLSRRDVNFELRGLAGGRPADVWSNVEAEHRRRLTTRYRELANREIALGRHRRAAYIYAKLLGDFSAAAATLAQGHHYREAAALYREKLAQPLEAARCLERGGLISEAIAAYEELGDFEHVGDLHVAIDQPELAEAAYRREVEKHRMTKDRLSAAKLLETKLKSSDEALIELADGWPQSDQADQCLREEFNLLARLGRHADAQRRLESLEPGRLAANMAEKLIDQFSAMASAYPDQQFRAIAADRTRVSVADWLPKASETTRRKMIAAIGRLVPADRLLNRDCQRFLEQKPPPPTLPTKPDRAATIKKCSVVSQFMLPADVAWNSFHSSGDMFYAAGYRDRDLVVIRGLWDGRIHQPTGKPAQVEPHRLGAPIFISEDRRHALRIHVFSGPPLAANRYFPATDLFHEALSIKSHPGFASQTIGVATTLLGDTVFARREAGNIVFSIYSADDKLLSTFSLAPSVEIPELAHAIPLPLHARSETIYIGLGDQLVMLRSQEVELAGVLSGFIKTLSGSADHSRTRILATFERGGSVFWDDYNSEHVENFALDLPDPRAAFTQRGWLAVAGGGEVQVYGAQERRLILRAEGSGSCENPISVVATDHADQFAVCGADGQVTVFQMPLG